MAITPVPPVDMSGEGPDDDAVARASGRTAIGAFVRRPAALLALAVLAIIILGAVLAPWLAPHDPNTQSPADQLQGPFWTEGGSTEFLLGTDELGRDLLSRVMFGARPALALAFMAATISAVVGIVAGLVAGMFPRRVGAAVMWVCDVQMAFPFVVLALVVLTIRGSSFGSLLFVLAAFGWVQFARVVRAEVMRVKQMDYVLAARSAGGTTFSVVVRHVLPNVITPVLVVWTFNLASVLLLESALSFLGLGIQPPDSDWGQMFATGRAYLLQHFWYALFPGLGITLTVLCVNVLGRTARDVLNPRLR